MNPDVFTGAGQALYRKARTLIPGGTQLLSKRPEMFLPELWPAYYSKAKGAECWDLDGRRFVDMSYCGIGATVLGFADDDVDRAVAGAIQAGSMCTLNCPEEVHLAELLCELHPWADQVRYARCGGESMAVAIRIARAATGRDRVAFCGYHGWHDWYLAANLAENDSLDGHLLPGLAPAGVPRGLCGTALPFRYNCIDELHAITRAHPGGVAAIVMEPLRGERPQPGFLEAVRAEATRIGAVLVFDEITSGWRLNTGGAHLLFGVEPDLAVFAKGMSNGYPMGAVIGREAVMQAAQQSFISSTYWTERIGPVAALATIRKHRSEGVPGHLVHIGNAVRAAWTEAAARASLPIRVTGIPPLSHFEFEVPDAQVLNTAFVQLMLERGFLAKNSFYSTFAHTDRHVERYRAAVQEVFDRLAAHRAEGGDVAALLKGPVAHTGFRRLA